MPRGNRGTAKLLADEGYDSDGNVLHSSFEAFRAQTNRLFDVDGRIEATIASSNGSRSSPVRK